jgi:hypothetical protein
MAALQRLRAPSVGAKTGITLGGRSFGAETTTGVLARRAGDVVAPAGGAYLVRLPAASAAMLTVPDVA